MTTIKFNNTEFEVEAYSRNTYFNGETIASSGSCTLKTNDIAELNTLMETTITFIQIKYDDTVIYTLEDIDAKIDSINEYLTGDRISITISMTFNI